MEEAKKYREITKVYTEKRDKANQNDNTTDEVTSSQAIEQLNADLDVIAEQIKERKKIISTILTHLKNKILRYKKPKNKDQSPQNPESTRELTDKNYTEQTKPAGAIVAQNTSSPAEFQESEPGISAMAGYIRSHNK